MSRLFQDSPAIGVITHAQLYRARGLMENAIQVLENGLTRYPNDAKLVYYLGMTYEEMGSSSAALSAFNRAIEILPDLYEVWVSRGVIYMQQGKEDEAIADFFKAIEVDSDRFEAYANLGNTYRRAGAYSIAIDHYKKAVEIVGNAYPEIRLHLGWSYQYSGQVEEALKQYEICLEKGSERKEYRVNTFLSRASLLQSIQSFDSALLDLESANQVMPDNHTILHRKGKLLSVMGRIEEALKDYQRAVELNSHCEQAVVELGLLNSKVTLERLLSQNSQHPVDP